METANRLKVAFLIDHYSGPGAGTERQMLLMAESLPRAGIDVRMAVFRQSEYTGQRRFPAPVESIGAGRVLSPLSWWRVYRWAARARRDGVAAVHVFFNDPALFAPLCLALAGLPCIVARRDMGFWYTPTRLFLLRRMQRFVACMTANSRAVAAHCGDSEGYPPEKRVVIPNAIPPAPRVAKPERRDRFVVGIVANIRPIKRIGDVVRAVALMSRGGRDVTLRVVGSGSSDELRALAESLGIGSRVEFAGASDRVPEELAGFDVAVLCSESEGLSNAIMEYMQAGLPVVATDSGGNAELVTEGETGLLYPVADVDALARCLSALHDDRQCAKRLGEAGAQRIRASFAVPRVAAEYASLYRQVSGDTGDAADPEATAERKVP